MLRYEQQSLQEHPHSVQEIQPPVHGGTVHHELFERSTAVVPDSGKDVSEGNYCVDRGMETV